MKRTGVRVLFLAGLALALALPASAAADRTVYVTNSDSPATALAAFSSVGGPLTPLAGTPVAAGDDASGVLVSPDARNVYVANTGEDTIRTFSIAADGTPTSLGDSPTANQPSGLGITPDGAFLLAANRDSTDAAPSVSVFAVDSADGTLTAVGVPVDVGIFDPRAVIVSPDGRFVYVTARRGPLGPPPSNADTAIAVLSIGANGSLTPIVGSPFFQVGEFNPFGASITPDGSHLYMAQVNSDKIDAFNLSPTTGAPTPILGSPFAVGGDAPIELSVTPDGGSLYATDASGQSVEGLTIAPATGALTPIAGTPVSVAGQTDGLALTPDGTGLYNSILASPGKVEGFTIGTAGDLTRVTGSPFASGGVFPSLFSVAVTPTQTPKPDFTGGPGRTGKPIDFNASATKVRGGSATRFDWDFGDGTTVDDGGSTLQHTYGDDGTFTVTLTVTNDCAADAVFTEDVASVGNAVYCNGPTQGTTTGEVTVDATVDGKVTAKKKQKQKGSKIVVKAKVKAGEKLTATLKGKIEQGKSSFKLKPKTKNVNATQKKTIKLKPKKAKDAKKIAKGLSKGKQAKAKLKAKLTDEVGNVEKTKLTVKLKAQG